MEWWRGLVDIIIISTTMVKLGLRLDDEVFNWLHAEAARLNVDVSTVVRRALRGERWDPSPAVPRVRKVKPGRRRRS